MTVLHLTQGLPASGKSTWAKEWVSEGDVGTRARVNRDDLRAQLFGTPDYSWAQERAVTEASRAAVRALLEIGVDVVADDMNLRPKYIKEWFVFASSVMGLDDVEIHSFPISLEDAIDRDHDREMDDRRFVGENVIRDIAQKYAPNGVLQTLPNYQQFLKVAKTSGYRVTPEPYTPGDGTPEAIIVDLDGTLANLNGRNPYNASTCDQDLPITAVIEVVQAAAADGLAVIYMSGRTDDARVSTAEWIVKHVGVPGPLYMRKTGDQRKDAVIKAELFDKYIRHNYNIRYVLDDRQQVVDMWRSMGIACFQVAPSFD